MAENQKKELNEQELDSVAGGVNPGGVSGNAVGVKPGGANGGPAGINKGMSTGVNKNGQATGGSTGTMSIK